MILDTFDQAFLINLEKRPDRLQQAQVELHRVGIKADVLPGIETQEKFNYHSAGARGCLLSHLRALHKASARSQKSVLIMEDDLVFRKDFKEYWRSLLVEIKSKPWDILYGYCWDNKNQFSPPDSFRLYRTTFNPCCHFWAIHSRAYDYVIDKIEKNDRSETPTVLDNIFTDDKEIKMYCPNYNLVGQRVNESDTNSRWQGVDVNQYNGVYWHG